MCTHTQLGINNEFIIHGRQKLSLQKGRTERSWTTDSVALIYQYSLSFTLHQAKMSKIYLKVSCL